MSSDDLLLIREDKNRRLTQDKGSNILPALKSARIDFLSGVSSLVARISLRKDGERSEERGKKISQRWHETRAALPDAKVQGEYKTSVTHSMQLFLSLSLSLSPAAAAVAPATSHQQIRESQLTLAYSLCRTQSRWSVVPRKSNKQKACSSCLASTEEGEQRLLHLPPERLPSFGHKSRGTPVSLLTCPASRASLVTRCPRAIAQQHFAVLQIPTSVISVRERRVSLQETRGVGAEATYVADTGCGIRW